MFYNKLLPVTAALVASIDPVLSQTLPCPPYPALAGIADTPEKCNCLYAMQGSGFRATDPSTFDTVLDDKSVQNIAQTGQWVGVDGITEYLSFVGGGRFILDNIEVGPLLILDMTGTTNEQCVITQSSKFRMPYNPLFTKDNKEVCVDLAVGSSLYYTMTGNSAAPVTIQRINVWFPDEYVLYPIFDTTASAELVCDTIVNTCGYDGSKRRLKMKANALKKNKTTKAPKKDKITKAPKKNKSTKVPKNKDTKSSKNNAMKECLERYNSLPNYDKIGDLTYADGNTKGCRMIHAIFARANSNHCPHVSFDAEEDINGLVKCDKSKGAPQTDFFTDQQLALIQSSTILLGLGPTGVDIKFDACPTDA